MLAMNSLGKRGLPLALVCAIAGVAGGCGGATHRSTAEVRRTAPAASPPAARAKRSDISLRTSLPAGAVAQIGPHLISSATLERWIDARMQSLPSASQLVPPEFASCVARLKDEPVTPEGSEGEPAQLRKECNARYEAFRRQTLERLISSVWVLEGAREVRAGSDRAVTGLVDGAGDIDPRAEASAARAVGAVRRTLFARARAVGDAGVSSYYEQHRGEYATVQELRDVEIAGAQTAARANAAKQELEAGKTFAQVVKEQGVSEADFSSKGLVLELSPTQYGEPNLNHAIFAAKRDELLGPISTTFGYFVFEVKKIHPGRYRPLGAVASSIRTILERERDDKAIAQFLSGWRSKWTARTSCSSEIVVRGCQGFDAAASTDPPPSLYSLQ
jgi:foldase protein PrsA